MLRNGRLVGEYADRASCRQLELVAEMIGKEPPVAGARSRSSPSAGRVERTPVLRGAGPRPHRRGRAVQPRPSTRARSSAWPACSAPAAPRSPGCSSAPTAPTTASCASTASRSRCAPRAPRSPTTSRSARRTAAPRAWSRELTVRENIILALQAARGWTRPIPRRRQDELVDKYIKALDIRPANPELPVRNLSGGNQQKVLLARWLITEPRLLILDEPTRGIDVGAKAEIQKLVVAAVRRRHGGAVHLGRAGGGAAAQPQDRRAARPAAGRRARPTTTSVDADRDHGRPSPSGAQPVTDRRPSSATGTTCSGRSLVLVALLLGQRRSSRPSFFSIEHARRPPLRQPDRHPAARRAADPGGARHDAGHRHRRHRPVGRLGGGDHRRARLPAHQRPAPTRTASPACCSPSALAPRAGAGARALERLPGRR